MDITAQNIIDEVRRLANEDPDFVYTDQDAYKGNCHYAPDNMRRCIMGQAMSNLGVPDEELRKADQYAANAGLDINRLMERLDIVTDYDQANWLCDVQSNQDTGSSWSDAVRHSDG